MVAVGGAFAEVKNEIGVSGSNSLNTSLDYRFGYSAFYGIIQAGVNYDAVQTPIVGVGLGTSFQIVDGLGLSSEAIFTGRFGDGFDLSQLHKGVKAGLQLEAGGKQGFVIRAGAGLGLFEQINGYSYPDFGFIQPITEFDFADMTIDLIPEINVGIAYRF